MSKNTDIDILIPIYNCESYIVDCLESIQNQTVKNKIFIIDDASTDSVKLILKKYESSEITIYLNKKNEGNLRTINTLLKNCKSSYVALQDADDWSEKNRLETQLDFMERKGLDFCFTNFIKTSNTGEALYCGYYEENLITDENINDIEPLVVFASILFKRKIYEKIGGFDEYFNHIGGADIDWFYRAFAAGFKGGIVKKPFYFYRNNDVSYTSTVSLDPRKHISVEIARYLYQYRSLHTMDPPIATLNEFISKSLAKINFDLKSNLKNYIVQTIAKKQYFKALHHIISFLTTMPFSVNDLKIIKYAWYKMLNGK